jgi:hypothetical protein
MFILKLPISTRSNITCTSHCFLYTICNCTCCLQVKLINLQLNSTCNEGQCDVHVILLRVLIGNFKMKVRYNGNCFVVGVEIFNVDFFFGF